jgi:hypothetical protein
MVFSWARCKKSAQSIPELLSHFALPLIGMHLINLGFNQAMIILQEIRMEAKSDSFIPQMFAVAFIGFMVQSLFKVLAVLLISYHFYHKSPLLSFLKKHTELGLIESLRAFFKSVLWGFLFIIPGIIKMIRYQFVVYIVASSKKYEAGEVDALEASEKLTQGRFWSLTFLILILATAAFALSTSQSLLKAPFEVLILETLGFFFLCWQGLYLLFLFQDLLHKQGQR